MKLLFFFIQAVLLLGSVFSRSLHRKLDAIEDDTAVIHEAYVVVFDDNISAESKESIIFSLEMSGGTIKYEYYDSFIGIAIEDASDDFLDEILDHPDVIRVMPVRKLTYLLVSFEKRLLTLCYYIGLCWSVPFDC